MSLQTPKRKRTHSVSPGIDTAPPASRRRSKSPAAKIHNDLQRAEEADAPRRSEKEQQIAVAVTTTEATGKENPRQSNARAEFSKLINSRSGGVYMPPARLRALQQAASNDKSSPEYQRLSWDALRKSITGIVNRVNIANIKQVVPELFAENLIRGRGLFARSIMKAQAASLPFTPVFAALVAIINTKLPQVGELLLVRLISQFRRSFKRNNKIVCNSTTTFIAHLVNQGVAHEIIALQILVLLLERPTDDSIEIAVGFMREVGAFLSENSPKANATVYERFRAVLNEGNISQRVQYMIEVLMQVRKDKYKDNPTLPEGLDLVEEEEQITHQIQLEEDLQVQEGLNVFKFDPDYPENEEKYKAIKAEILGEDDEEATGSDEDEDDDDDDEEAVEDTQTILDRTETNLVNLRRVIYLTIMNALNYEEAVHKLLKVQLQEGQEIELVNMLIECCSQERSYSNFYGLVSERFCKLNRVWTDSFEAAFGNYYETIHRYETNRLRNISRTFGHLLATDSISWAVFECIKINEDDTTSSSRIFIKILMSEMMESMGLKALAKRFKDEEVKRHCVGMFPMDVPKNTRFAINYFTSIGLGVITEEMREWLKNAPKLIMEQRRAMLEASSSSSNTSSDSDSESDSDSDSDNSSSVSDTSSSEDSRRDKHRRSRRAPSPPPKSVSRRGGSRSPPPRRPREESRSPPPRRRHDDSPPYRRGRDTSPSPRRGRNDSPSPRRLRDESPPPRRDHDNSRSSPRLARRRYPSTTPPPPSSRYRDSERARGDFENRERDRDMRRQESPPHMRANENGRRKSPERRDRLRRDQSPPAPLSPPPRSRYIDRHASRSRSRSRSRQRHLDSRRDARPRSISRERGMYGRDRSGGFDGRRPSRSRERDGQQGYGHRRY